MRWHDGFIAVDWGTTNRRAYAIGADGRVAERIEDDLGILSIANGGFVDEIGMLRTRFGDRPMLLAGMIGSNRGWIETPYVPCPARLADLVAGLVWVEKDRLAIVPGLSFEDGETADVMRGEEVQIFGAAGSGMVPAGSLVCHPGTHNKWIALEGDMIAGFRTVMTGELFNLLKEHSILGELLAMPARPDAAFERGVRHGLAHDDLTAALFSVRAGVLLGRRPREEAASHVSGLLIGSDLRIGLRADRAGEIAVIGSPDLTRLYAAALAHALRATRQIDGDDAFVAGARMIAEQL